MSMYVVGLQCMRCISVFVTIHNQLFQFRQRKHTIDVLKFNNHQQCMLNNSLSFISWEQSLTFSVCQLAMISLPKLI